MDNLRVVAAVVAVAIAVALFLSTGGAGSTRMA